MSSGSVLNQLNVVVRDMGRTVDFYRRVGLAIDAEPGAQHVAVPLPSGFVLEFDSTDFVRQWDTGWAGSTGGTVVLGFGVDSRADVDRIYGEVTAAGYAGHQPPYDAFWGARYAIVDDPDGNPVGIMSPIDAVHKTWPPAPPPVGP